MRNKIFNLKTGFVLLVALMALMLQPASLQAQLTRGAIAGTVRDESGAVVPGATVTITQVGTNFKRDTTTNDDGFYRVPALDPGTYSVVIEKTGFTKVENREVLVKATLDTTFDTTLKAGSVTAVVDVTSQAEAITLNKTNATIGLTATSKQAVDLPLSTGRDVNQLALLSPNAFTAPGSTGISVNGQRARNNNFTIDGSDNNDITVTIQSAPVIPEAVAEYQIQTNPYSVEFGRNSGAQINVITKSGTNKFHGDGWEYYRGSALNARDNLEKASGLTRPARFNRNQFGFDIGGPVLFPHFGEGGPIFSYDGRDRTFFFFTYQGDRLRSGGTLQSAVTIPTPAGFAQLSNVPLRAASGSTPAQTAASRQAVLNQLAFLSKVYQLGPSFRNITNTTINGVPVQLGTTNLALSQPNTTNYYLARVDHKLSDSDNLTVRYNANKPVDVNVISNTNFGTLFAGNQTVFSQNLAFSETHVFSPTVVNEFRASYIRRNLDFPENDPTTSTVTITGLTAAGTNFIGGASNFPQSRLTNYYQFSDTVSAQMGRHAMKFGADIRRNILNNVSGFDVKGTFVFNNLADYLNNNAFSFTQAVNPLIFKAKQWQQYYFVQDDFHVTPSLTLNLGLRYENATNPFGFFGATDPKIQAALVPGPVKRDNNNFAPGVGFAYSPQFEHGILGTLFGNGLGVLRGGYRINYDLLFFNILTVNGGNYPFTTSFTQNNVVDVFPNLLPTQAPSFNPLAGFVNTPSDAATPYSQLYSLSYQREIRRSFVLEVGYSGSHSLHQVNQLQANPAILTAAQIATVRSGGTIPGVQARRLYPQFGSRTLIDTSANAMYNAGYVTLNKRLSRGLQFGVAYTFSKLMSDNDESLGVSSITSGSPQIPQDFFNRRNEWSLSAFDRRHRFVAHYIYDIPTPGFARDSAALKQIFGGWEISGITSYQSGQPFTVLTGVDTNGNGTATGDRPNYNPNGTLILDPVTHNFRTFSQSATNPVFIVPRTSTGAIQANGLGNGNLGRNTFRAPYTPNTNISLQKNFRIDEAKSFKIRADFLNAFNQDNYGIPVVNMSSPNFGRNLNNWGNRSITLSGKFTF